MAFVIKGGFSLHPSKPPSKFIYTVSLCKPVSVKPKPTNPKLIITGPSTLSGHVHVSGSKNSALALLAATICCSGTSKLQNVPAILDIDSMLSVLRLLGAKVEKNDNEVLVSSSGEIGSGELDSGEMKKTRGGFLVIGPLVARFGEAVVPLPGGCDIGTRPVDLHLQGLRALGAVVQLTSDGKVAAHAANRRGLVGGRFRLDYPSVGATETLMMAASLADGTTLLSNVAKEPEVVELARFLTLCGACVEGAGTENMVIKGRRELNGTEFCVSPDRIEAGTFILAAAITRSCISISPVIPSQIACLIQNLKTAGCRINHTNHDILEVSAVPGIAGHNLRGFDVKTSPFPGFPTDLQPQTMALLTTCEGISVVEESVFDNRIGHARELQKLGARIQIHGKTAVIYGKSKGSTLSGANLTANDLRGGMALVLAGLAAQGTTQIEGVAHIDRGYENFATKLKSLGANIKRAD